MTHLLQVVPEMPPAWGGVGGFAAALGGALGRHGLASHFLVAAPGGAIGDRHGAALAHLLAATGGDTLLVHYANYAYHHRGCPTWLVDGVIAWRRAAARRRLVTFFHELYASGPPWRSSFWLHPAQRRLASRLARASDGAATSLGLYADMLGRWRPRASVLVAPVPSTVGEPLAATPLDRRQPRTLVVFGGAGNRRRAYGELAANLALACDAFGVAEIIDLGPPLDSLPATVGAVPVRALGPLPDAAASTVLQGAFAGFVGYPAPFLEKSTVFAAYCAHGVVPVTAWRHSPGRRRCAGGPPAWHAGAEPPPADPASLAAQARDWYAGHSLERQAAALGALLTAPADERLPAVEAAGEP